MSFNVNNNNIRIDERAVFQSLDSRDGNSDGKINYSIWNKFADEVGGKHISQYILQNNAERSIRTYIRRGGEAIKEKICKFFGWAYDNGKEVNKNLNEADSQMTNMANMDASELEFTNGEDSDGKFKIAKLSDGKYIKAYYDKNGEIDHIFVSFDTSKHKGYNVDEFDQAEVRFNKTNAFVDGNIEDYDDKNGTNNLLEFEVKEGYDFEKYKRLAEQIFGKQTATEE